MSYLRYMYLFAHSGVPHILCCVFALFYFTPKNHIFYNCGGRRENLLGYFV
jgi:hypothetical protein